MDRTRIRSGLDADRISNLPTNVIDNILKFLPLHDTVRTSVLSKGWQYKWVNVPYLAFDWTFKENLSGEHNIESIIYQVLLLHKGPIVKFTLGFFYFDFYPSINNWLFFLSDHRVEELHLSYSSSDVRRAISHHLFTFDHLKHLILTNVVIRPPSTFKGFGRLVSLDLIRVEFEPEELNMFTSKCPMLEYLNLDFSIASWFRHLDIDAPNLKSFCFWGILSSIYFKNATYLGEMSITCFPILRRHTTSEAGDDDRNMIKILGQLSSITRLCCNNHFLQLLTKGGVPHKLPVNLNNMRDLVLSITGFGFEAEVRGVLCLITSSPNLQRLQITSANAPAEDMLSTIEFLKKAQQETEIPLCRLDTVTIRGFSYWVDEKEFLKRLLSAATVLRRLELHSAYHLSEEEQREISEELLSFRRASSQVEIVFQDPAVI
ncbi:F-box/FBD/LRR-repeat protein [Sesamum alatum]|uniref:F-box/FBD/LRR-repeat protein n=1 Tax=Sesamum alatum TaxID=300844 RepID=A0AAE1YPP8_9LAMI|nr:F-box/FBD/LRR-repeat protein [Sesamum alatum]